MLTKAIERLLEVFGATHKDLYAVQKAFEALTSTETQVSDPNKEH